MMCLIATCLIVNCEIHRCRLFRDSMPMRTLLLMALNGSEVILRQTTDEVVGTKQNIQRNHEQAEC